MAQNKLFPTSFKADSFRAISQSIGFTLMGWNEEHTGYFCRPISALLGIWGTGKELGRGGQAVASAAINGANLSMQRVGDQLEDAWHQIQGGGT